MKEAAAVDSGVDGDGADFDDGDGDGRGSSRDTPPCPPPQWIHGTVGWEEEAGGWRRRVRDGFGRRPQRVWRSVVACPLTASGSRRLAMGRAAAAAAPVPVFRGT